MEQYRDLGTYDGPSGFEGAVGKIVRAKHQLRDLEARFEKTVTSQPIHLSERLVMRPGENIGDYTFVIEAVAGPKREWGVLIGELVHNLRSALDHAVYAAATAPNGNTAFPVVTDTAKWEGAAAAKLHSVPQVAFEIVRKAQPFYGAGDNDPAGHPLAILNRLWNHDKHRMLQTAVVSLDGAAPGFQGVGGFGTLREVRAGFGALNVGDVFVQFTLEDPPHDAKLELIGEFGLGIVFADTSGESDASIDGLPVYDVLLSAFRMVQHTVVSLEFACKNAST